MKSTPLHPPSCLMIYWPYLCIYEINHPPSCLMLYWLYLCLYEMNLWYWSSHYLYYKLSCYIEARSRYSYYHYPVILKLPIFNLSLSCDIEAPNIYIINYHVILKLPIFILLLSCDIEAPNIYFMNYPEIVKLPIFTF